MSVVSIEYFVLTLNRELTQQKRKKIPDFHTKLIPVTFWKTGLL